MPLRRRLAAAWLATACLAAAAGCGSGSGGGGDPCAGVDPGAVRDLVYTRGFGIESRVFAARADGGGRVRVSPADVMAFDPALSPDGCRVAYLVGGEGPDALHVAEVDGDGATPLAGTEGASAPAWSPKGDLIAFVRDNALRVVAPNGGGERTLTPPDLFAAYPSWSPDGERIVFSGKPDAEVPDRGRVLWDLYVVDAAGGEPQRLTRSDGAVEIEPAFSPDGGLIVYQDEGDGDARPPAAYTLPSDGAGTPLRVVAGAVSQPSWTPEGRILLVRRTGYAGPGNIRSPVNDIVTVAPGGGDERVLFGGGPFRDPVWRAG